MIQKSSLILKSKNCDNDKAIRSYTLNKFIGPKLMYNSEIKCTRILTELLKIRLIPSLKTKNDKMVKNLKI